VSAQFWIQASNPRWQKPAEETASCLAEAIEEAFPLNAENAFVVWHNIYVPLSYKYDVSLMMRDALWILGELLDEESGSVDVDWPSNTFAARWQLVWKAATLTITCLEWRCVVGETEKMLRLKPIVSMRKMDFVFEWKALLERVLDALNGAGFTVAAVPELSGLIERIREIDEHGMLYRKS